jgi:hypothetical protein
MAKRLHDTDCWKKEWFRHLSVNSKILWLYILDSCDCAGIWEKDLEMASFLTSLQLTDQNLTDIEKQIKPIDDKRFIVLDFIEFQYGELKDTSKMKKPVFNNLAKFGLKYPIDTVSGFSDTVKRKRKDKDKDKDKEEEVQEKKPFEPPNLEDIKKYFIENGYPEDLAIRFFQGYHVADWKDSKGNQVRNWKQKAFHVWFKSESKISNTSQKSVSDFYGDN